MEEYPKWLDIAMKLQAIARTGLHYADNHYEIDRYEQVEQLAMEMMAEGSGIPRGEIPDLFVNETGYVTPKVEVRGVVLREGRVLLVREIADYGRWTLPGGWADVCLTPAENIVREIREESGFETRVERLLAVFDRRRHDHRPPEPRHCYKMFFLCEITGGEAAASTETSEVRFFDPEDLPELSVSRVTAEQIKRMAQMVKEGQLKADVD
ncbi:NUDIX hydrolase [bacterium]|nr:NUDIX hydrolase [bacterium]